MLHKDWSSIEEVPYCFWKSSVKFQGHTAKKIVDLDLDWVFPDCNSSLNSLMAMKCCTKLETAKERCPFVSKVIHQISRSHRTKHHRFWPKLGFSGLKAGRSFQIPQICLVQFVYVFGQNVVILLHAGQDYASFSSWICNIGMHGTNVSGYMEFAYSVQNVSAHHYLNGCSAELYCL